MAEIVIKWFFIVLLAFETISSLQHSHFRFHRHASLLSASRSQGKFKFGLIADIQYADSDDALNFQQTRKRRYRQSLEIYKDAMEYWDTNKVDFALVLGDVVDGRANLERNQIHCIDKIVSVASSKSTTPFYCFGNHCHYCFSRSYLQEKLIEPAIASSSSSRNNLVSNQLHFDWSPHEGWRFVSLDGYDVSLIGSSSPTNRQLAENLLRRHNHNNLSISGGWFKDLPKEKHRWVPYNGGVSSEQLLWLRNVLSKAQVDGERVVLFCHQPIFAPHRPQSVIWNSEEVLQVLWSFDNVVLYVAGHDHGGKIIQFIPIHR